MSTEIERIATLETQMEEMMGFRKDHLQLHKDKEKDCGDNNQNRSVNRAAYMMIGVGLITVFVQIWSTNAVIKSTQQPQHVGIERTFQGEARP